MIKPAKFLNEDKAKFEKAMKRKKNKGGGAVEFKTPEVGLVACIHRRETRASERTHRNLSH